MLVTPELRRLRREDQESKTNLDYIFLKSIVSEVKKLETLRRTAPISQGLQPQTVYSSAKQGRLPIMTMEVFVFHVLFPSSIL